MLVDDVESWVCCSYGLLVYIDSCLLIVTVVLLLIALVAAFLSVFILNGTIPTCDGDLGIAEYVIFRRLRLQINAGQYQVLP